ncbi:hypothetical protein CONLIGDRAFT_685704 [Coniochaeta ligniaria NRRL 30616]|uniref:Uncharacterized protein n=1 Tax=Coniochaeta ligniaria NRRL 30616 TaxID=1408157 RepID=A0A1J7IBD5_9PEZI|nr:hypothetical protein CONLIGDRAFT_685704 [Coniochaeta ligniaria NRRL 30616]
MARPRDEPGYSNRFCPLPNHGILDHGAASTKPTDSHCLSSTLLGIQREHMSKQAGSLFTWDDAILFRPRPRPQKQPETPETPETGSQTKKPKPDPNQRDSDVCIACIADWLLAFFGILVVWAMYSSSDQWVDAWGQEAAKTVPVPDYVLTFWRTVARLTLLWVFIFWILAFLFWVTYSMQIASEGKPHPHLTFATHLVSHILSCTSSYLAFWWNHGRHNKPHPLRAHQLDDVSKGAVLLRLTPYPDIFTTPLLGWLNSTYLTYRDWQRWRAAGAVWAELERTGRLYAEAHRYLAEVITARYMEQNGRLGAQAGHLYLEL